MEPQSVLQTLIQESKFSSSQARQELQSPQNAVTIRAQVLMAFKHVHTQSTPHEYKVINLENTPPQIYILVPTIPVLTLWCRLFILTENFYVLFF